MARAPASAAGRAPAPAPRPASAKASGKAEDKRFGLVWFAITFMLVVIFSLPTVILVFFGLLPTIVAYIIDRTPHRYSAYCVGGFNFAGLFPYLMDLWIKSHEVSYAFGILTDVFSLLVIYGSAGFGWMVFIGVPPVVAAFLSVMSQRRIDELRGIQSKLVAEWGPEASATTDAMRAPENKPDARTNGAAPAKAPPPRPAANARPSAPPAHAG